REPPPETAARDGEMASRAVLLSATDPANPYGAALPWPSGESRLSDAGARGGEHAAAPADDEKTPGAGSGRRPARAAGAIVVLVDGALAAWMGRAERHLVTFLDGLPDADPADVAGEVARALGEQVAPCRRRALFIKECDGRPVQETPMGEALAAAGFTFGPQGYMKRL
ncbi:MAG TPA: hypothetical protein VK689_16205, partial [Armatimonadota bacterium]|nr:hypothetical protein [Armatimonadota bacterium]